MLYIRNEPIEFLLYCCVNKKEFKKMLSDIERVFPVIGNKMIIDIDKLVAVRRSRSKLFDSRYFTNKFWDILLILYNFEIQDLPINADELAQKLEIDHRSLIRYLDVLAADQVICAFDTSGPDRFDIAVDYMSLSRTGSENVRSIVQQTRRIFAPDNA